MTKVLQVCNTRPQLKSRKSPELPMEKRGQTEAIFRKESSNKLKDPKPLLKLAHNELKTGGALGCCVQHLREASSLKMEGQLLPSLVLEKLLYQALVRCIEERDFRMGLEVSQLLCGCFRGGSGKNSGNSYPSLHFPSPSPQATMDTSKLVIGAIINTSRCCLELGGAQCLRSIVELCKNCDCWLGTVEEETAAGYRERMFHIAWRVAATSVADLNLATACWCGALHLLANEKASSRVLIQKVHHKGLALEKKGTAERERSLYINAALEMYRCCHTRISGQYDPSASTLSIFSVMYIDWLQHFASLSEYVGSLKEAKSFLKTAYGYVAAFASASPRQKNDPNKNEKLILHAYVVMLKLHMASMTTAQCSNPVTGSTSEMEAHEKERRNERSSLLHTPTHLNASGANALSLPSPTPCVRKAGGEEIYRKSSQLQQDECLKTTTPYRGRGLTAPSTPFTVMKYLKKDLDLSDAQQIEEKVFRMISRAWDYVEGCTEMLEQFIKVLREGKQSEHQPCDEQATASIAAVLKAWRWVQRGCGTVLFWTDAGKNAPLWQNLHRKAFSVLASLSRSLLNFPPSYCSSPALGALSSGRMLFVAIDSYIRLATATASNLDDGDPATATKMFLSAENWLKDAEDLLYRGNNNSSSFGTICGENVLALFRRIGAGWFCLGKSMLTCCKSNVDEITRSLWRGCELLECWAFSEGSGDDPFVMMMSVLQMDLRLMLLSKCLVMKGDIVGAALAAIRTFVLCLDMDNDTEDSILDLSWGSGGILEGAVTLAIECLATATNEDKEECIISSLHSGSSSSSLVASLIDYLHDYTFECRSSPLLKREAAEQWEQRRSNNNNTRYVCLYRILIEGLEKRCSLSWKGREKRLLPALLLRVCKACSTALAHAKSASTVAASAVMHRGCEAKLLEYADSNECPTELHIVFLLHSAGFERQLKSVTNFLGIDNNNNSNGNTSSSLPDLGKALACVKQALKLSLSMNDAAFLKGTCEMLLNELLLLQGGGTGDDDEKQTHMVFCTALDTLTSSSVNNSKSRVIVKQLYEYYRSIVEDYFLLECDLARRARAACLRGGSEIARVIEGLGGAGISYYRAGLPGLAELYFKEASRLLEELTPTPVLLPDTAHIREDDVNHAAQGVGLGRQPGRASATAGIPSIAIQSTCECDAIPSAEPELSDDTAAAAADHPASDVVYSGNSVQMMSARTMCRALGALLQVEQGNSIEGTSLSGFSAGDVLTIIIAEAEKLRNSNPASEAACYAHAVCLLVLASILECQGNLGETINILRSLLQICIRQASKDGCKGCENNYVIRMLSPGTSMDHRNEDNEDVIILQSRWLALYLEGTSWLGRVWKTQSFSRKAERYVHMSIAAAKQLKGGGGLVRKCLLTEAGLMISKRLLDPAEGLLNDCDRLIDEQCVLQHDAGCLSLRHWKREEIKQLHMHPHRPCCGCLWVCAVQSAEVLSLRGDLHRHRGHLKKAQKCYADGNTLLEGFFGAARNDPRAFACSIEACSTTNAAVSSCSVSPFSNETVSVESAVQLPQLSYGLLWRLARAAELLGDWISAQPLYEAVIHDIVAPSPDKGVALYRLARHALDKGGDASKSRELLQQAIAISRQHVSPRILRKLRRTAVVAEIQASVNPQGSNNLMQTPSWDTATGHLLSIGIAHCNHILHNEKSRVLPPPPFSRAESSRASEFDDLKSATERLFSVASGKSAEMEGTEALKKAVQQFSLQKGSSTNEWIVVGLSVAPTNHLLFTRLRLHRTKLHSPVTVAVQISQEGLSILSDWRSMMENNTASLKNNAATVLGGEVTDQKKLWWKQRETLNSAVENTMVRIENEWFKKVGLDTLLLCKDINEEAVFPPSSPSDLPRNDTSHPSPVHRSCDRKVLSRLTVAQLKEELALRGVNTVGCRRKPDFIELLLLANITAQERPSKNWAESDQYAATITSRSSPLLLILDENLLGLSWEAMPCLRGHIISRIPALPFIFSLCTRRPHPCWSSQDCRAAVTSPLPSIGTGLFVVDPENNLPHTREALGSALGVMTAKHSGWEGYVGEKPPPGKIIHSLQERDWFIYCGHGSGGLLVDRDDVASLPSCSRAILMGCSSGRLKGQGDFEPSGMVAGYLFGGCQAVVANLWDVTDRDIDRYSLALFNNLFLKDDNSTGGLCKAVAVARAACKMQFIVGHAPVCYGLPI